MDVSPGILPCQHMEQHSDPTSASLGQAPLATWGGTDPVHSTPKSQCSQCQDAAAPPCPGQAAQPWAPLLAVLLMSTSVHLYTSHPPAGQSKHISAEERELQLPMLPG